MPFKIGDVVRLKTGTSLLTVTAVYPQRRRINAVYRSTPDYHQTDRRMDDFVLVGPKPKTKRKPKEKPMSKPLFQTPDGEFGTLLTTNSLGQFVVEIKGTGAVKVYDEAALTEIMPYTIEVRFDRGPTEHFEVKTGQWQVDDVILDGFNIGRVTAVDTKSRGAPKRRNLRRLVTETVE